MHRPSSRMDPKMHQLAPTLQLPRIPPSKKSCPCWLRRRCRTATLPLLRGRDCSAHDTELLLGRLSPHHYKSGHAETEIAKHTRFGPTKVEPLLMPSFELGPWAFNTSGSIASVLFEMMTSIGYVVYTRSKFFPPRGRDSTRLYMTFLGFRYEITCGAFRYGYKTSDKK